VSFRRICRTILLCACTFSVSAVCATAQAVYGSIVGTITDATGGVLPGAKVTVLDLAKGTSQTVQVNSSGGYTVEHLIPDAYQVKIEMAGYKTTLVKEVPVSADSVARIDEKLEVGSESQSVEVIDTTPQLKVDKADISDVIDQNTVKNVPVMNRNFTSLAMMVPGTTFMSGGQADSVENPQGGQAIFFNGLRFGGVSYQLDGTDNRDPVLGIIVINPTLESVNEVKITTSNFDAEFGNALAAVITAQTKSGSNDLHGSLFNYRRSGANQARDPFTQYAADSITGRMIPASMWDQFGGSIGGPVKRNKIFFFGDYQGTRRKTGQSFTETVPTALVHSTCLDASKNCDLSEYGDYIGGDVYNPDTGAADGSGRTAFANYLIPHSKLNTAALNMLKVLPLPTVTGAVVNNYTTSGTGSFNDDSFNTRVDYQRSEFMHVFGRYSFANFNQLGAPVFGTMGGDGYGEGDYAGRGHSRDHSIAAGFDYALSPKLMTDFRFGYFRYLVQNNKWDAGTTAAKDFGMTGLNTGAWDTSGMPSLYTDDGSFSSLGDNVAGCNCPLTEKEQQVQFVNNWTRILANHQFKFGADYRYATNLRSASDDNRTGDFDFNYAVTADADNGGGLGLASFLLGDTYDFSRFVVASNSAGERQKRFFAYGQDVWRIARNLTATIGLRWEDIFPETVSVKGMGGFVNLDDGYVHIAGLGGQPTNGGQSNKLTNFAPRLGLAWQINDKTALRAGWGRSFDEGVYGDIFGTALTHNIPVTATQSLSADYDYGYTFNLASGPSSFTFPTLPTSGLLEMVDGVSYSAIRPGKMRLPDVDAWNLSLQRQVTPSLSVDVAYVGNKGQHVYALNSSFNINQAKMGTGSKTSRRPLYNHYQYADGTKCCSQNLWSVNPVSTSTYNALQVRVEKRFGDGLQIKGNYTWSNAFDHSNNYFTIDPSVMRGPVDYNRKQIFTANGYYELPIGRNKRIGGNAPKWADYLISGYQISSVTGWASGLPFSWSLHRCNEIDTGPCRPDHNGSFSYAKGGFQPGSHIAQWFTPVASLATNGSTAGAWAHPAAYTFGDAGRNTGAGPRSVTSDISLAKKMTIKGVKTEFNMDAFNAFNHPVLATPSGCVDCTTGGQITALQSDSNMRQLMFGVHLNY